MSKVQVYNIKRLIDSPTLTWTANLDGEISATVGGGTVTSFSAGNLSPLFTTSVANPTTTPALSFSLSTHAANLVFAGPTTGGAAAPTFRALVAADIPALAYVTGTGLTSGQLIVGAGGSAIGVGNLSGDATTSGGTAVTVVKLRGASLDSTIGTAGAGQDGFVVYWDNASSSYKLKALATTLAWSSLTSAAGNLTLSNAGFTTEFDQTSAVAWTWANTTAATSSVSQSTPILTLSGTYWTGSVSATDSWTIKSVVANGTNGTSTLTLTHTGSTGVAAVSVPAGTVGTSGAWGLTFAGTTVGLCASANILALEGTGSVTDFRLYSGSTLLGRIPAQSTSLSLLVSPNGSTLFLAAGTANGATGITSLTLGNESENNGAMTATSGTAVAVAIGRGTTANSGAVRFNPSSGNANFVALNINPSVNQTSTASGSYTALKVNVVETSLKGTANKLLDLQAGATGGTSMFSIDNTGAFFFTAAAGAPTSAGTAGTAGQFIYNGGNLYLCSVTGGVGAATWNKVNLTAV